MENELIEQNHAVVPSGLADDQLLAVAEAAEKRVAAVNKIKILALKVTNSQDWNDQGGKPYMAVSGAEKVARLFGISWRLDVPTREDHEDGHFSYTFKGFFAMGTAEIEVIGTRSSKDPFFSGSKDRPIPPSEIDRNDVKKGAMTNCLGNGISRLLGIRNMSWEELEQAGIKRDAVSRVHYRDSDPNAAPKLPNYGRNHCKGKPMDDPAVTLEDLQYYMSGVEKSLLDPAKAQYKTSNERTKKAIQAELERRQKQPVEPDGAGGSGGGQAFPTETLPASQQASDAAPFNPETCPPAEEEHTIEWYCRQFRTMTDSKEINALYKDAPKDMQADIYQAYTDAMKSARGKK